MVNVIRPSDWYYDLVFEELKIHYWSRAITLNGSYFCWRVVIVLLRTTLKKRSLFDHKFNCSNHSTMVYVRKPFPNFLHD